MLYEAQTYASFQTPGQHSTPGVHATSVDDLKASPQYVVGTPDEVLAKLQALPKNAGAVFNPLAGGTAARARVVEPGIVRGEGAAAPDVSVSLKPNRHCFLAYRRRTSTVEVRHGSLPQLRLHASGSAMTSAPLSELDDVRLRRAGLKAVMSGLELALATPVAQRDRLAASGQRCAQRGPRGVDAPHRRDRGARRVPRRARPRNRRACRRPRRGCAANTATSSPTITRAEKRLAMAAKRRRLRPLGRGGARRAHLVAALRSPGTANAAPT